jgi:DNA-binding transcriptional MerR regulator/predicted transcriptional regulator YdeE
MLSIGDFARLGHVSPRMLRHYEELGLLRPVSVDPATGYRSYGVAQLARLHRLLALRDLGLSLDQIRGVLDDDPPLDELRGMLRIRRAQIEAGLADDQARLRRVEAHLRAIEGSNPVATYDIVLKRTDPLRVAEAVGVAPGFGSEHLGPVFQQLVPEVLARLDASAARPGNLVAWYEQPSDEGEVVLHAGFDIGDQAVEGDERVRVVDLPIVEVASVVHQGSMEQVEGTYVALVSWIEDSDYRLAGRSRELYLEWNEGDESRNVTELQMPITR